MYSTLCCYMIRQWRWVGSHWVAHIMQSLDFHYSGHIVFSLPGCTQLLSMFVWEKSASAVTGLQREFFFFFFFTGNVFLTGLSNSVLVGCFKFHCSVGCKTSSFLLTTAPSSSFDFLFSFALLHCSFSLTQGREGWLQKFKQLCNKEMEVDVRTAGGMKILALLLCSAYALSEAYQMWRLRETISTDNCSVEYKLCQTAFQGDYSIKTNGRRRTEEIYID